VSGIFLPLRVKSLPLATIYEVKIPLRKGKKSLLQRNPAQMTSAIVYLYVLLIYGLGEKFFSHILHSVIKEIKDWH
jgi:hypothetical protein